jgi:multidrug efflux pump subunit AcrB
MTTSACARWRSACWSICATSRACRSPRSSAADRALNVWLDPQRLEAAGLTLDKIRADAARTNVAAPLGELVQDNQSVPLRLAGFLGSAEEVGKIVVGVSGVAAARFT